jgi:hypothetical protein
MDTTKGTSGKERIEALRQRERQIRAAIAIETVKRKRREFKEFERLKSVIGGALLAFAAQNTDVELMLKGVLKTAAVVESEKKLLRAKGWL